MAGQQGVKETKELVVGLISIAAVLATHLKDGVQVADAVAIFNKIQNDPILKSKLESAYQDIELVKGEVGELDFADVLEIVAAAIPEIKLLVEAIHGD